MAAVNETVLKDKDNEERLAESCLADSECKDKLIADYCRDLKSIVAGFEKGQITCDIFVDLLRTAASHVEIAAQYFDKTAGRKGRDAQRIDSG